VHGAMKQIFRDANGSIYGVGAMTFELPLPNGKPRPTFYNRHGDWFAWACTLVTIALMFAKIFRRKRAGV
jgi:apolipoprotein N-acyltransferase